jgi:opacity protein-like surface antigen
VREVVRLRKRLSGPVLGLLMVLVASRASAQDASPGYIEGTIGSAAAVERDSAYAGLGVWRLNGRLELFGEVGRLRNAIGRELSDRMEAVRSEINASNVRQFHAEFPIVFEARVPTWYGLGGIRANVVTGRRTLVYVEGGAGTARLDPQVHLTINGDNLDSEAAALAGLGEGRQQLAFVTGGGGGVAVQPWRRIRVEAGYRYMRLFGEARTNIHRLHVGGGWVF